MSNVARAISGSGTNAGSPPAARRCASTSMSRSVSGTTAPTSNSSHSACSAGTYRGRRSAAPRAGGGRRTGPAPAGSGRRRRRWRAGRTPRRCRSACRRPVSRTALTSPAIRPSLPCTSPWPASTIRTVRRQDLQVEPDERCSTYQRSSSIRSDQGSDARPLTCAQPVIPGLTAAARAGARCSARPGPAASAAARRSTSRRARRSRGSAAHRASSGAGTRRCA